MPLQGLADRHNGADLFQALTFAMENADAAGAGAPQAIRSGEAQLFEFTNFSGRLMLAKGE